MIHNRLTSSRQSRNFRSRVLALVLSALTVVVGHLGTKAVGATFITVDHCLTERLVLHCNSSGGTSDDLIMIHKAMYGRMRAGRCITANYMEASGCQQEVTSYVVDLCSGRSNCSTPVTFFDSVAHPCQKDFKTYLQTTYECVEASFTNDCRHGEVTRLTNSFGYLALYPSYIPRADLIPPGPHKSCPWVIVVESGKQIRLSWKVFPVDNLKTVERSQGMDGGCQLYYREEDGDILSSIVCRPYDASNSVEESEGLVVVSKKNRLELHVTESAPFVSRFGNPDSWKPYVLEYRAVGCADIDAPDGTATSRHGNDVTVTCHVTNERWYLSCNSDEEWVGQIGNCSKSVVNEQKTATTARAYDELKSGVVLAVVVGIVLGICVGACMMFVIFIVRKSRDRNGRGLGELDAASNLYDVYTKSAHNKNPTWRCPPALFVHDSLGGTSGAAPLFEYTYACTTTGDDIAHAQHDGVTTASGDTSANDVTSVDQRPRRHNHDVDLFNSCGVVIADHRGGKAGACVGGGPGRGGGGGRGCMYRDQASITYQDVICRNEHLENGGDVLTCSEICTCRPQLGSFRGGGGGGRGGGGEGGGGCGWGGGSQRGGVIQGYKPVVQLSEGDFKLPQ